MNKKTIKLLVLVMTCAIWGVTLFSSNVYAVDNNTIMKKWVFTQYYQCIEGDNIEKTIDSQTSNKRVSEFVFKKTGTMYLPSYQFQHSIEGDYTDRKNAFVNCYDLFTGDKGVGVLRYTSLGNPTWRQSNDSSNFLKSLGYSFKEKESGSKSIIITANTSNDTTKLNSSSTIEIKTKNDGKTLKSSREGFVGDELYLNVDSSNKTIQIGIQGGAYSGCHQKLDQPPIIINYTGSNTDEIANSINTKLANKSLIKECSYGSFRMTTTYSFTAKSDGGPTAQVSTEGTYTFTDKNSEVIKKLSKISGYGLAQLRLTDSERFTLYQYYLSKALPEGAENRIVCDTEGVDTTNLVAVELKSGGNFKSCYVNFNTESPETIKVTTQEWKNGVPLIEFRTMRYVIDWMNTVDKSNLTDVPNIESIGVGSTGKSDDLCYDSGVDSQGWVLCPALNNMTYTATTMDMMIQDWLEVDTDTYDASSPTHMVWEIVRNIANGGMVIILLVIIFSQLTGYGIDNYGIKKMLPKLIVMAVLINLSFVICQLAVDLSNILGEGLRNMFGAVGNLVGGSQPPDDFIAQLVTTLLALAASMGPTIAGAVLMGGPMGVIVILLALVGVMIAILLFFVMLAARRIIVILCIALAPVAFLMYIMPNTQSVFKKWWDLFKAALIMFPICGAVGGISNLIKVMMMNSGDSSFGMGIVAFIAPFLPFFFLPTMLKGMISMMGKIGAGAMAIGASFRKAGSGAVDGVKSSKGFQERAQLSQERAAQARTNRIFNSMKNKADAAGGVQNMDKKFQQRFLQVAQQQNAYKQKEAQAKHGVFELDDATAERRVLADLDAKERSAALEEFGGMSDAEFANVVAAVDGTSTTEPNWYNPDDRASQQKMAALLQTMEKRGMTKQAYDVLRNNNNVSGSSSIMQTLAGSGNYLLSAYGKKGAGMDFRDFETKGTLQNYIARNDIKNADDDSLAEIMRYARTSTVTDPNGMQTVSRTVSPSMAISGAVSSQTPKVREQFNAMVGDHIANMGSLSDLNNFNLKAGDFSTMNDDTAKVMENAVMDRIKTDREKAGESALSSGALRNEARKQLRESFNEQIAGANGNAQINTNVTRGVGEIFGIKGGSFDVPHGDADSGGFQDGAGI